MSTEVLHTILLCIHLLGVFLLLIALSILLVSLIGMRRVDSVEKLRAAMYAGPAGKKILPVSAVLILGAGVWMALLKNQEYNWHSAWILFAFFTYLLMFVNGTFIIGPRLGRVGYAAATSKGGELPPKLKALTSDPALHYPAWINVCLVFAFVYLMVGKPGWLGSLITILAGILAGIVAAWLVEAKMAIKQPRQTADLKMSANRR